MEALGQTSFDFGTDSNNAHVQPDGAYHYHGMPEGFVALQGKGKAMTLIGWAADGFPIYARYGYSVAERCRPRRSRSCKAATAQNHARRQPPRRVALPHGHLHAGLRSTWPAWAIWTNATAAPASRPSSPSGTYHYYATDSYPYLQRCVKGQVSARAAPRPARPS